MKGWNGKYILITGGSGGLGARIALEAAKKGGIPVLFARRTEHLLQVKEQIEQTTGISSLLFPLDVANSASVQSVFQEVGNSLPSIDVLINNAGFGVFEEFKQTEWDTVEQMFQTNVLGLMACTQAVLPFMERQGYGHIINIASQAGKISTAKSSVYAATKHAVIGFSNGLRMEIEDLGIHVTTVNPGPIATDFFNIADKSGTYIKNIGKFLLQPEKVASHVIKAIENPKREINLPKWMNAGSTIYQVMPGVIEKLGKKAFKQK